jgi:hypothetical protein
MSWPSSNVTCKGEFGLDTETHSLESLITIQSAEFASILSYSIYSLIADTCNLPAHHYTHTYAGALSFLFITSRKVAGLSPDEVIE